MVHYYKRKFKGLRILW